MKITVEEFISDIDGLKPRQTATEPCPLCGSNQIQVTAIASNPMKSMAKCRDCKCQAPLLEWNKRGLDLIGQPYA